MKLRVKSNLIWISLLSLLLLLSACSTEQVQNQEQTETEPGVADKEELLELSLGHIASEDYTYHDFALEFKKLVEEKTNGKVLINIFPNALLGDNRELIESMQFGSVDFAVTATAPMTNFVSEMGILDLPYLFRDWAHTQAFINSDVAKELLSKTEVANLKSLVLGPLGFRNVTNSQHPIVTPADLQSIKLRVLESEVYLEAFEELGALVVAMPWGEAYTAMQQGAIDGQENDLSVIYAQKVYDVQEYVSLTEHIFAFMALVASSENFNKWPLDVQEAVQEAALEANAIVAQQTKEKMDQYKQLLEAKGMKINEVDKEAFAQAVVNVQGKYKQRYGEELFTQITELR